MNKTTSNVGRGQSVGRVQDRLSKRYEFEAKYLCDNDQTEPVRILFGRDCLTTTQLVPIFNLKEVQKKTSVGKGGKGGSTTQTEYYGGLAFSICVGEVEKLYRIYNADDQIFYAENGLTVGSSVEDVIENNEVTGSVYYPYTKINISADGSSYGTLRFYSGVESYFNGTEDVPLPPDKAFNNQITLVPVEDTVNEDLNVIPAKCTPAFKGICYFASDYFRYGTSNSVPNLRCEVQCSPKQFYTDLGVNAPQISELDDNGDTYIPLVIYEILRNSSWGGAGLSENDIDLQSFHDALEICYNEHNVVSPCFDSTTSIRDAISQCLEYVDGVLVLENDKITLKLIRNGDTLHEINKTHLVEEPKIRWSGADDTWGVTKVTFNERINSYESTSEVFESPLYNPQANFGVYKTNDYNLPWIKTRYVAAMLARRLGHVGAVPDCEATLTVLPSAMEGITCGSLISLTYEKLNIKNLVLRVNEITFGKPEKPSVELKCVRQVLTDWEIDSDVFSKYLSRFTRQEFLNMQGGWYKPRVLPVYSSGVDTNTNKDQTPNGFFCFVAKNPNCPTTNLLYKYARNKSNDAREYKNIRFLKAEISDDFEGGYSVFGQISSITINNDQYEINLDIDDSNYDWYEELRNASRQMYIGTCAWKKSGNDWVRYWKPVFWRVDDISYEGVYSGKNRLKCTCTLNTKKSNDNTINKNYYGVILDENKILPSQNAYLFVDESVLYKDWSLRYGDSLKFPFIDVVYTIAYFSQTKEYEDETKAGHFVLYRTENSLQTLISKYNPVLDPDLENYDENLNYGDPLLLANMQAHLDENFDDAWGQYITLDGSVYVTSDVPVFSSDDENSGDTLIYCTADGNVYNSIGEVVDTFDNSAYVTNQNNTPVPANPNYYIYREDSTAFAHTAGQCGLVHVHIINETAITLPIPSAITAENGDMITILVTRDAEVQQDHISLGNTENFYNPPEAGNTLKCATGEITKLICTQNKWLIIQTSKLT